jgi:hypothetical protein
MKINKVRKMILKKMRIKKIRLEVWERILESQIKFRILKRGFLISLVWLWEEEVKEL